MILPRARAGTGCSIPVSLRSRCTASRRRSQRPKYDAIVSIDVDKNSVQYFPGYENFTQYREHLESQTRFSKASVKAFPTLGCTVTIWRPTPEAAMKEVERTLVR